MVNEGKIPGAELGFARDSGVAMAAFRPFMNLENVSCRSGLGSGSSKVSAPSGSRPCKTNLEISDLECCNIDLPL